MLPDYSDIGEIVYLIFLYKEDTMVVVSFKFCENIPILTIGTKYGKVSN